MMKIIVMPSWQRKFRCEGEKCRLEAGSGGQGEGQGGQGGGLAKPLIFNQPRYQVMTTFLSSGEIENLLQLISSLPPSPALSSFRVSTRGGRVVSGCKGAEGEVCSPPGGCSPGFACQSG